MAQGLPIPSGATGISLHKFATPTCGRDRLSLPGLGALVPYGWEPVAWPIPHGEDRLFYSIFVLRPCQRGLKDRIVQVCTSRLASRVEPGYSFSVDVACLAFLDIRREEELL